MVIESEASIEAPARRPGWRLGVAFALGAASTLPGIVFGMPGRGEFVPTIWLAAFVALVVAPGWPGFVTLISGVAVGAALLDISDGTFGLVFLIVAITSALAAHGALSATVVLRLRTLGWRQGLQDQLIRAGGGLAVGLGLIFVWLASDVARNPP